MAREAQEREGGSSPETLHPPRRGVLWRRWVSREVQQERLGIFKDRFQGANEARAHGPVNHAVVEGGER